MSHLDTLHEIVRELVEAGIEVHVTKDGYQLHGFNKIGSATLKPVALDDKLNEGYPFTLHNDRYADHRVERVESMHPILGLYMSWWQAKPECGTPSGAWLALLQKYDYVTVETRTVTDVRPKSIR